MDTSSRNYPNHLAYHETLEIHELVAFQSVGLMKMKKSVGEIQDAELRTLYVNSIKALEQNITELLQFFKSAPREDEEFDTRNVGAAFYAGDLLAFFKTAVRNYAIAITETATPVLRETLTKQLQKAIQTHALVYAYMYKKGLYPSYNMEKLLKNDIKNAHMALKMKY
ncbi:spore coat protein [Virgibacillus byunsanensis]|uniref:Spore coat protein n=1 Tax=Virgibacillus byunsanensis TaxID=570945 RepID=A0ABW3LPW7_9BACI